MTYDELLEKLQEIVEDWETWEDMGDVTDDYDDGYGAGMESGYHGAADRLRDLLREARKR